EPAPAQPPPTSPAHAPEEPPSPPNCVSLLAGVSQRLGAGSSGFETDDGFSLGGSIEHTYARFAAALELGVAFEFLYDRASMAVIGVASDPSGGTQEAPGTRTVSSTNFGLLQTLAIHSGRGRAWIGA